jgi:D-alanyl-D-alanine carboxypeptidase
MLKLYPGAMGMKTGYTILARHNLITAAERNGTILIGVELHEDSWGRSYTQMAAMLDNGFGGHIDGGHATLLARRPIRCSRQRMPRPCVLYMTETAG